MFKIHKFSTKQLAEDALEMYTMNMPSIKFSLKDTSIYIETEKKSDAVVAIMLTQAFLIGCVSMAEQLKFKESKESKENKNPKDTKGDTKLAMDAKLSKNSIKKSKNPNETVNRGAGI